MAFSLRCGGFGQKEKHELPHVVTGSLWRSMGLEKAETGRPVRRLPDNPGIMGAHTKVEAVEAEDSQVEFLD